MQRCSGNSLNFIIKFVVLIIQSLIIYRPGLNSYDKNAFEYRSNQLKLCVYLLRNDHISIHVYFRKKAVSCHENSKINSTSRSNRHRIHSVSLRLHTSRFHFRDIYNSACFLRAGNRAVYCTHSSGHIPVIQCHHK